MNWTHAELGDFEFAEYWWSGTVELPAFRKFSYDTGEVDQPMKSGRFPVHIHCDDPDDVPSAAAISLVSEIKHNQDRLCSSVAEAIWSDFEGTGPSSGMWWEGSVGGVIEHARFCNKQSRSWFGLFAKKLPPLVAADSLHAWMQLSCLTIRKNCRVHDGPMAQLEFDALFDPEHGCGFLTDGHKILGIGYGYDVDPFSA